MCLKANNLSVKVAELKHANILFVKERDLGFKFTYEKKKIEDQGEVIEFSHLWWVPPQDAIEIIE